MKASKHPAGSRVCQIGTRDDQGAQRNVTTQHGDWQFHSVLPPQTGLKSAQRFSGVAGADRSAVCVALAADQPQGQQMLVQTVFRVSNRLFCQGTSIYIWRTFSLVVPCVKPWVLSVEREGALYLKR